MQDMGRQGVSRYPVRHSKFCWYWLSKENFLGIIYILYIVLDTFWLYISWHTCEIIFAVDRKVNDYFCFMYLLIKNQFSPTRKILISETINEKAWLLTILIAMAYIKITDKSKILNNYVIVANILLRQLYKEGLKPVIFISLFYKNS